MRRADAALRLSFLLLALAAMLPAMWLARRWRHPSAERLPVAFHRLFLRVFDIRVRTVGTEPSPDVATLILANHVSWLDIPVMASLLPLSFVAKHEISAWPVVGALARLQRCIFIDRVRKAATAEVNAVVARRLGQGDAIVLFPEGTTGDGVRLLPFKSSLVGAARAALADHTLRKIRLQPLAIAYVRRNGLPTSRRDLPAIAWYGDMELAPHVAGFLGEGPIDVVVAWGEPIAFDGATDRKHATAAAEAAVRQALTATR